MAGQDSLPLRRLKEFQPLGKLTDDQLVLLASRAERRAYGAGQRVIERGVRDGMEFFSGEWSGRAGSRRWPQIDYCC
jgi:hypothetical protein